MSQSKTKLDYAPVTSGDEYKKQYWDGWENIFIRWFSYLTNGVNVANQWRYFIMILGGGVLVESWKGNIDLSIGLLVVATIIGVPILAILGRWDMFRVTKARSYISTLHGNITQFQSHNMQVLQTRLITSIAEKMGVDINGIETELLDRVKDQEFPRQIGFLKRLIDLSKQTQDKIVRRLIRGRI